MAEKEIWTTLKVLTWTKEYLLSKGVDNARLEAEWLLCAATGLDRVGLYMQYDKPLNEKELYDYRAMVSRRARREPLQHILGSQEFYGLDFDVCPDVLIPRHDTEVLITQVLAHCPAAKLVLDVGTGSGCIAITLKKHLPDAHVTAIDISSAALLIAGQNAKKLGVEIDLREGSLFAPVVGCQFDVIVSNPPYIPSAHISELDQEVRDFDPLIALDGGTDGLDIYRTLIPSAWQYLNTGGWLFVEIGIGQEHDVQQLFQQTERYDKPIIIPDPAGIKRVVGAQRKSEV